MNSEQDKQGELRALSEKLDSLYSEWKKNCHKADASYADASKVINLTRAMGFCTDPVRRKEIEKELEALKPEADFIEISVTPSELFSLMLGLENSIARLEAEKYVKESLGEPGSSEQRWSKVAEIMLIKKSGERSRLHGGVEELITYWVCIEHELSPRKASEEVFKKFKHNTQEACDKWLRREIERRQREQQNGVPDFLANLPKPGTGPR